MKLENISMTKLSSGYAISANVTMADGKEYHARCTTNCTTLWDDWMNKDREDYDDTVSRAAGILECEIDERLSKGKIYPNECFEEI